MGTPSRVGRRDDPLALGNQTFSSHRVSRRLTTVYPLSRSERIGYRRMAEWQIVQSQLDLRDLLP